MVLVKQTVKQNLIRRPVKKRAGDGTRTRDNLLGRQALYQLSYSRTRYYFNPPVRTGQRDGGG